LQLEVEDSEDAFLLDAGMGPMTYLTSDARVLWDHRSWDGIEIICALCCGRGWATADIRADAQARGVAL